MNRYGCTEPTQLPLFELWNNEWRYWWETYRREPMKPKWHSKWLRVKWHLYYWRIKLFRKVG